MQVIDFMSNAGAKLKSISLQLARSASEMQGVEVHRALAGEFWLDCVWRIVWSPLPQVHLFWTGSLSQQVSMNFWPHFKGIGAEPVQSLRPVSYANRTSSTITNNGRSTFCTNDNTKYKSYFFECLGWTGILNAFKLAEEVLVRLFSGLCGVNVTHVWHTWHCMVVSSIAITTIMHVLLVAVS